MDIPRFQYEIIHELVSGSILPLTTMRINVDKNGAGSLAKRHTKESMEEVSHLSTGSSNRGTRTDMKGGFTGTSTIGALPTKPRKLRLSLSHSATPHVMAQKNIQLGRAEVKTTTESSLVKLPEAHQEPLLHTSSVKQPNKENTQPKTHKQTRILATNVGGRTPLKCVTNSNSSSIKSQYTCTACNKNFKLKTSLYKHQRKVHCNVKEQKGGMYCRERECSFKCRTLSQLRTHLQSEHAVKMDMEYKAFQTYEGK